MSHTMTPNEYLSLFERYDYRRGTDGVVVPTPAPRYRRIWRRIMRALRIPRGEWLMVRAPDNRLVWARVPVVPGGRAPTDEGGTPLGPDLEFDQAGTPRVPEIFASTYGAVSIRDRRKRPAGGSGQARAR